MVRLFLCLPVKFHHMRMIFLDGDIECSLSELLVFFSGTNRVPPTGFVEQPALIFVHQGAAKFPTASTCDLHLRLPSSYTHYSDFE